jgi:hypothetical protein
VPSEVKVVGSISIDIVAVVKMTLILGLTLGFSFQITHFIAAFILPFYFAIYHLFSFSITASKSSTGLECL